MEKSCKTREASCKWSTIKCNVINTRPSPNILRNNSSIQLWSTRLCHKNWTYWKFSLKLKKHPIMSCKWSTIKIMTPLDLQKGSCKFREILWVILNKIWNNRLGMVVTIDLQKKSFIETGQSYPHWLKITLKKELGQIVQKYRITI